MHIILFVHALCTVTIRLTHKSEQYFVHISTVLFHAAADYLKFSLLRINTVLYIYVQFMCLSFVHMHIVLETEILLISRHVLEGWDFD